MDAEDTPRGSIKNEKQTFKPLGPSSKTKIRTALRTATKTVAGRFYQFPSVYTVTAPLLRGKWK